MHLSSPQRLKNSTHMTTINEREKRKLYDLEKRQVGALEDIASELELLRITLEQFLRKSRGGGQ